MEIFYIAALGSSIRHSHGVRQARQPFVLFSAQVFEGSKPSRQTQVLLGKGCLEVLFVFFAP
jgi:hypothetical protein